MQDPRQPWQQPRQAYNQQPGFGQQQGQWSAQQSQGTRQGTQQQTRQPQQPPQGAVNQPVRQQGQQVAQPPQQQPGQGPPAGQQMPRPRFRRVSVEEVLQTDLVTVPPNATVATISKTMASEDVGTVVVVDDGAPLGIITDRDLALAIGDGGDVSGREASDFISGSVQTATSDVSVFEALERMESQQIRRLPIVDDNGAVRGIVALDDVLVFLGEQLQSATGIIRAQSPRL